MCRCILPRASIRHLILIFHYASYVVTGFQPNRILSHRRKDCHYQRSPGLLEALESYDNDSNNNDSSGNSMRQMLELSWNKIKMGKVPVDADAAAEETYSSILRATVGSKDYDENVEESSNLGGIFFVDLLLPAYDKKITGKGQVSLYDEVEAVQYCISLASCFKGKSEIIVRDDKTVSTVNTVLNARERERNNNLMKQNDDDDIDVHSDVNDLGVSVVKNITNTGMDSFRQKLISNWDEGLNTLPDDDSTGNSENQSELNDTEILSSSTSTTTNSSTSSKKNKYRVASLFGNTRINIGPDMATNIIQAVRSNALANDDEDNIIILNSIGKDEMVAVRALVTKYATSKKIILVNCKFQPTPRELLSGETVYSVLPLMVRKKSETNDDSHDNIKVVVIRRFPRDWEIFVDIGSGYELAESVPVNGSNKRGLSMELIGRATARHLDFTSRR